MSTQLILYPQHYNGQYNFTSISAANSFMVNGVNFTALNFTSSHDSSTSLLDTEAIAALSPLTVNTWYRLRYPASTPPALPLESGGNLVFNSIATQTYSGVFQRLSGLTIGQSYDVTVDVATTGVGTLRVRIFNGTTLDSESIFFPTTATLTHTFIATATDNTFMLLFNHTGATNVTINSISITPQGISPSFTYSDLQNGQVIVDLYENEDIPLTLSVDDFKNVAEKVQSYSKAFNLPATKRNNQIFDNIFDITRSDDGIVFNPYVKTQCSLKQDGFILFEGYLKLIDIPDKDGEISYNINLYSEVVAFGDILKDRTFNELDLSELTHIYTKASIKNSWDDAVGLPLTIPLATTSYAYSAALGVNNTNALKYPFVDWEHSYTFGANGFPVLPNLESSFRPFIQVKYLIQTIFAATPFTFTSNFFDTTDFKKLFMDFNWGGNTIPTTENQYHSIWSYTTSQNIGTGGFTELRLLANGAGIAAASHLPPNYDAATYTITATTNNELYQVYYSFKIQNVAVGVNSADCRWLHNSTPINALTLPLSAPSIFPYSNSSYTGTFFIALQSGDTLKAQFNGDSNTRQGQSTASSVTFIQSNINVTGATINTLRSEMGQWDFLKGVMTMFNLVSVPDKSNPNNILIEPYNDMFLENANSKQLDWTEKIDVSQMKLTPLTDLNKKTIFKFAEDDDDYIFNVYKESVFGHLYGSKVYDASGFTILQGEEEIVAEPFAATIPKPLMPQFPDFIVPTIYAYSPDDGTSEGFDNAPRIMYNNGIKSDAAGTFTSCTYYTPAQNGLSSENSDSFLQFSHLTTIPTVVTTPPAITDTNDFNFGECQLVNPIGSATPHNLFNTYWLPYFNELYSPDTRTLTIKVNLTPGDLNAFNFYDTVFIKNREFRINKIDYKPGDLATVEFILIP
tara:strand:+ start:34 stop:2769 length:2736 start_codon:yes stop_codon:yes gene_type:complete